MAPWPPGDWQIPLRQTPEPQHWLFAVQAAFEGMQQMRRFASQLLETQSAASSQTCPVRPGD